MKDPTLLVTSQWPSLGPWYALSKKLSSVYSSSSAGCGIGSKESSMALSKVDILEMREGLLGGDRLLGIALGNGVVVLPVVVDGPGDA